jgi:5-methyltetrahydrofolate--homocysteine methyltransferase
MSRFIDALRSGKVLVMDGAMGTELHRLRPERTLAGCELANLSDPELVLGVHRAYLEAGAEVLLTNTFQANPAALARQSAASQQHAIWDAACRLARSAGVGGHFVFADIGPIPDLSAAVIRSLFDECRNLDGILLETWSSLDDFKQIAAAKDQTMPPLLVSFTFWRNAAGALLTFAGASPEECARAALEGGAVALGANCGRDIDMPDMIELVQRYRSICDLPIFVRPNAGTPARTSSSPSYPRTPAEMAQSLPALLGAGSAMVGGCCGTTPEHIKAFRKLVVSG